MVTIPYKNRKPINILINDHTKNVLSDPALTVRSFSMTDTSLSLCISKEITPIECTQTLGIDRNLRNITCGNDQKVTVYKTNKLLSISESTIHAKSRFKRNDKRKKQLGKEKRKRITNRRNQYLHRISKGIVDMALKTKSVIKLNLKGIRKLYRSGNGQGNKYRRKLNAWPFYELQRQIEYKAAWVGVSVQLVDPKRTSKQCPRCGNNLQEDTQHKRKLLCTNCGLFMDRDVVAAINISRKLPRFRGRDGTSEAQSGIKPAMTEPRTPVIRIVDMSKGSRHSNCLLSKDDVPNLR